MVEENTMQEVMELSEEAKRNIILTQLAELDKIVSRPMENMLKFMMQTQNYMPYQVELDTIQQKETLRSLL